MGKRFARLIAFALTTLIVLVGGAYIFIFWLSYEAKFYSPSEIQSICEILNLHSTEFCESQDRQTSEGLQNALQSTFTPLETTYSELSGSIQETIYFNNSENCDDVSNPVYNLCPLPSQCTDNYVCYINISENKVYFVFDNQGRLLEFLTPQDNS